MSQANTVVVISRTGDKLSDSIIEHLSRRDISVMSFIPEELGSLNVTLSGHRFQVNRKSVKGIFFRVSPNADFSHQYCKEDRSFIDAEIRSVWLGALHCDSIFSINRYDAISWFEGIQWYQWRRRLLEEKLAVSKFTFGESEANNGSMYWYPYASNASRSVPGAATCKVLGAAKTDSEPSSKSIAVNGTIVAGPTNSTINTVAKRLKSWGIFLAEIVADRDHQILRINTQPHTDKEKVKDVVSQNISQEYYAHMYSR